MKTATAKNSLVTIVIPAYNEELTIPRCLKSIANQDYKNIEVIVIDDFSSDKTSLVVKELAKKFKLDLKVIRNKSHKERGVSRNLGAKQSKGKYLLFIDSDMQLSKKVISDSVRLAESQSGVKAIIIPEDSFGVGFWSQCKRLEKRCYQGDDKIEASRFFEKNSFWKIGGWDEKMISGEDWDLTRRFREKYLIARIKSKILHDEGKLTFIKIAKKKFYYATKSQVYLKKYPLKITDLIFFIIRPAYIKNWKSLIADPVHLIGLFVLKSIELLAGVAGFLYSKLVNLL